MAMYYNELTDNKKLWIELNIVSNEELKSYMDVARAREMVALSVYADRDGHFVKLHTDKSFRNVTKILSKFKSVKRVRQELIAFIQEEVVSC